MPKYLVAIHHPDDFDAMAVHDPEQDRAVDELNDERVLARRRLDGRAHDIVLGRGILVVEAEGVAGGVVDQLDIGAAELAVGSGVPERPGELLAQHAADARTHFGIFSPQVWKLFPRNQTIHLSFWDYNDVAPGYFPAAEIAAREQKVGIISIEVARPDGRRGWVAVEKIDLGEVWTAATGLPFVYAFWAVRAGVLSGEDVVRLQHARDRGLQATDAIAAECGWSRAQTARIVADLEAGGHLARRRGLIYPLTAIRR